VPTYVVLLFVYICITIGDPFLIHDLSPDL